MISNRRLSQAFRLYTLEPLIDGNWLMPEVLGQHLSVPMQSAWLVLMVLVYLVSSLYFQP